MMTFVARAIFFVVNSIMMLPVYLVGGFEFAVLFGIVSILTEIDLQGVKDKLQ